MTPVNTKLGDKASKMIAGWIVLHKVRTTVTLIIGVVKLMEARKKRG